MNNIPCDVVILPDPSLASRAMAVSQQLSEFDSYFVLQDGKYFPHASLYMLQLNVETIPEVIDALSIIAKRFASLQLQASRYDHAMGFIDVEYHMLPELRGLQREVVQALNPLRDGMRAQDVERMKAAHGLALENFETYGYKYVGKLFRPHMTLSRLKHDNLNALKSLDQPNDFSGRFMQLGLFELGDNGTCRRKINTFAFR